VRYLHTTAIVLAFVVARLFADPTLKGFSLHERVRIGEHLSHMQQRPKHPAQKRVMVRG
jgi:hypothetical protein